MIQVLSTFLAFRNTGARSRYPAAASGLDLDRPLHLAQRWLTYRRRWAIGDLFMGRYGIQTPLAVLLTAACQAESAQAGAHVGSDAAQASGRKIAPRSVEDLFSSTR
jgi:hypothetical protein